MNQTNFVTYGEVGAFMFGMLVAAGIAFAVYAAYAKGKEGHS